MTAKDVIDRRYLQLYLARLKRKTSLETQREIISTIQAWVRQSTTRTKKKGGLGRK